MVTKRLLFGSVAALVLSASALPGPPTGHPKPDRPNPDRPEPAAPASPEKAAPAQLPLPLLTLRGHTGAVWCVQYSPDGTRLATASNDRTAAIWDAATGKKLLTLRGHSEAV